MIYKTLIINNHGADLFVISPVKDFSMNVGQDETIEHVTNDPYNVFSRYESITFLPGIKTTKQMESSNVATISLKMAGLKLKTRKNFEEPKRKYPTCWFLNEGGSPMETLSIDCFDWGNKVYLIRDLPVLKSVPIYSIFAEYKRYIIRQPVFMAKTGVGCLPGAGDMIPNYCLEDKRKGDDLARMKRLLNEWKNEQKNQIKVII